MDKRRGQLRTIMLEFTDIDHTHYTLQWVGQDPEGELVLKDVHPEELSMVGFIGLDVLYETLGRLRSLRKSLRPTAVQAFIRLIDGVEAIVREANAPDDSAGADA